MSRVPVDHRVHPMDPGPKDGLSHADRYLNQVIGMPGFPGYGIRRGCVLMAMKEAGYDRETRERFACTDRRAPADWPLPPNARGMFAALLAGDMEGFVRLSRMGDNGGPALDDGAPEVRS